MSVYSPRGTLRFLIYVSYLVGLDTPPQAVRCDTCYHEPGGIHGQPNNSLRICRALSVAPCWSHRIGRAIALDHPSNFAFLFAKLVFIYLGFSCYYEQSLIVRQLECTGKNPFSWEKVRLYVSMRWSYCAHAYVHNLTCSHF